jgi:hypothetical protein
MHHIYVKPCLKLHLRAIYYMSVIFISKDIRSGNKSSTLMIKNKILSDKLEVSRVSLLVIYLIVGRFHFLP